MRRALVTGAASGIGAQTCETLRFAGWDVVAADRTPGDGIVALEVTSEPNWDAVVAAAWPLDALVNCAGVRSRAPIPELPLVEFDRLLDILVSGSFLGIKSVASRWKQEGRGGAIVNIASVVSTHAVSGLAHYVAAKAGVAGLTRASAVELATDGIRVNAIAPGVIRTPMTADRLGDPEQLAWLQNRVPMARVGEAREIADAVEFLLSDRASYITGVVLPVDGGWTAS